ncbi:MAG: alpha/beta hydrolase, partial [Acidobacteriota bacterium]
NGIQIHYLESGRGPDVVMLHGFLGNLAVWHLRMVPELRREHRIVTYDLRGHGYSDVTPRGYTAAAMAEDLLGLLDRLGIDRPILIGHSFGADVCLYFAFKYPDRVRRLAALEPGLAAFVNLRKDPNWEGWTYWVGKLEEAGFTVPEDKRADLGYLFAASLETPKFYGPARGLPRNREALLNLLRNTSLVADYEEVGELTPEALQRITTDTLLVYGEKSHFLSTYEILRRQLPRCTPLLLPGGEHFGPLEQPDLLISHLTRFLREPASPELAAAGASS